LDADDTLYPEAVEQQVAQSESLSDSCQIVFGDARYVRPDSSVSHETSFSVGSDTENPILYILTRNLRTPLPLHQRSMLEAVDGFDESLPRAQEYDLHFRLTAHGARFVYRPTWVVRVLGHDDPDRISNQDHFSKYPRGRLERIQERAEVAESLDLLDEALRICLALGAWHGGRKAVRAGFPKIADEYFELARSLHNDHVASSSQVYRWIAKSLGPHAAEWLVERVRSVQDLYLLSR
jgi:hypothetical protein